MNCNCSCHITDEEAKAWNYQQTCKHCRIRRKAWEKEQTKLVAPSK
jgi:hypothetical protein